MTKVPEDSPQGRGERGEAEDWLRRELAFLHGVERRVVRRARVRAEVWRAGVVGLIFVMFASCWYVAALSSTGYTGTACPVSSSSVDVGSTAPTGGSDGAVGPYGLAASGRTVSDGAVQGRDRATGTVYAAAQPAAGAPASSAAAPGAGTAKPGKVTATGVAADRPATAPGTPANPGTAKPAESRGPLHPHPRPGGIPRRKAVKPQGAGGATSADPVKPAVARPADGSSSACGV